MFSGAAWIVLCLLLDFWTLAGDGDGTWDTGPGVDWLESLGSAGTL